jgi:hypothetical protein
MKKFSDKILQEIKAYILCSIIFCFENRAFYDIMRKIMVLLQAKYENNYFMHYTKYS